MRRLALASVASIAVAVLALGAVLVRRVDPEFVRGALTERLEAALELPVALGPAELSLLPLPAVRIHDVQIGAEPGPSLRAPQLRAAVSLVSLLRGRAELRSIELTAPQLRWDTPKGQEAAGTSATSGARAERSSRASDAGSVVGLRVADGTLEIGGARLEHVALKGELGGAADPVFEFSAQSPLLGPLAGGRLELSGLAEPAAAWRWSATARLDDVDLEALSAPLEGMNVQGRAAGRLVAAGRGPTAARAELALEGNLAWQGRKASVEGRVKIAADLAGALAFDLTAAKLRVAKGVEKPVGVPLRIAGQLRPPQRALALAELSIESDALRAAGRLDLPHERLELDSGSADLAQLAAWSLPPWVPRTGRLRLESVRLEPGAWPVASGQLSRVGLRIGETADASLSGRVACAGTQARTDGLRLEIAGEEIGISGGYDWQQRRVDAALSAGGVRLEPLARALWGREGVSGRLYGNLRLAGPPQRDALTGAGDFEVREGELPGLSLVRAAGIDASEEEPPGLDRFEQARGRFELVDARLEIQELTLVQAYATAVLSGRFYLRDMSADLTGIVSFDHPALAAPVIRPILRMAGKLDALETHISDAETDDVRQMEAHMIEAIRKVEAERRSEQAAPEPRARHRSEG